MFEAWTWAGEVLCFRMCAIFELYIQVPACLPNIQWHTSKDPKRVYYLSLEFLLGRSMDNALLALGLKEEYKGTY